MNRENKKKSKEKGYYKTHACKDTFVCKMCGRLVVFNGAGSEHRNHCPYCLHSMHLDNEPGDRAANCGGIMEPVSIWVRRSGEWAIIHRCKICEGLSSNRIVADDNPMMLMSIDEGKRKILYKYLNEIEHNVLEVSKEAQELANQIIKLDILRPKSIDDATHIGVAVLNNCDYIISWNFKHLVNIKTVNGVRAITSLNGLSDIGIVTPTFFLGED